MKRSLYEKLLYVIITVCWRLIRAYCNKRRYNKTHDDEDHQG